MAGLLLLIGKLRVEVLSIPWRVISIVFVLLLALLPIIVQEPYVLRIITFCAIYAIFAASWDLLSGFTGQLSLGHALFFGLSAYTTALLAINLHLPVWVTIPIGTLMAVAGGMIMCLPALRLRGFYLALVTLAFPIILSGIIDAFPDFTGGDVGLSGLSGLTGSRIGDYYLILVIMLCSVLIMWKLTDTSSKMVRMGLILRAIREDEISARASGINTTFYKIIAFATSGFFAGIAGGLYAHYLKVVGPSTLDLMLSFQPVLWTIFGGIGTIYGAVAGTFIVYSVVNVVGLTAIGEKIRFIAQAVMLALVLLYMPEGLIPWIRDHIEVTCPRCKLVNFTARHHCRACRAVLHPEKEKKLDTPAIEV
ncbi:MAG: branched-chain amino acid ABC transporter permease [Dehalococcoidia bacterium]